MEAYQSNQSDWSHYAYYDRHRYTRNLIDNGNGHFNLILLCWGQTQQSPIHDHSNSHCMMKMLAGQLVETQYSWPEEDNCTLEEEDEVYELPMQVM